MKKLLVIGLIASSFVLGGCFKEEKLGVPEVQKQNQESPQNTDTIDIKMDTWTVIDSIEKWDTKVEAVLYWNKPVPGFKWSVFNDYIRIIKNWVPKEILSYNSEYFKKNSEANTKCLNSISFNTAGDLHENWSDDCKYFEKFIDLNENYLFYKIYWPKNYWLVVMNLKSWDNIAYFPSWFDFSKFDTNTGDFIIRLSLNGAPTYMKWKIQDLNNKKFIFDLFGNFKTETWIDRGLIVVDWENEKELKSLITTIDSSKEFNLDDYIPVWTYTIVQKFEKDWYSILTLDPNTSTWTINNTESWASCMEQASSTCITFITNNNKLLFTNLKNKWSFETDNGLTEDLWWIYKIWTNGVIFYNVGAWWGGNSSGVMYTFTYINFKTLNKIYENYAIMKTCDLDKQDDCIKSTEKTTYAKNFYDSPWLFDPNKKLNIKSTNIEDAYFEYYKEEK